MALSPVPIDPTKFKDRDFKFQKIAWSLYEVDHKEVKGILRVLAVPINIFEVPLPPEMLPPGNPAPIFGWTTQAVVSFKNLGKKGPPNPQTITQEDYLKSKIEDITSSVTTQDEPFNEYIIGGNPALLLRAKTVLTKAEWIVGQTNVFGDPALWVNHDTSHSTSELKLGDLTSR